MPLGPHAMPTKTERRGARCPAPSEIAALPFRWPTRLADGLELEVFYVWLIQPDDSPRAPLSGHVVPPRCRLLLQLRQTLDCQRPNPTPVLSPLQLKMRPHNSSHPPTWTTGRR